jgi:hypothetical protein
MGSGPNAEVDIGIGKAEIGEEGVGHQPIIVLAGMHQNKTNPFMSTGRKTVVVRVDGRNDGRGFHEVRPGANYKYDFHADAILRVSHAIY